MSLRPTSSVRAVTLSELRRMSTHILDRSLCRIMTAGHDAGIGSGLRIGPPAPRARRPGERAGPESAAVDVMDGLPGSEDPEAGAAGDLGREPGHLTVELDEL